MIQKYAVALGAGCAAAFLFAVSSIAGADALPMALAYLAPLPIMIATMGWGLDAGAIAAAASVAGLTVIAEPLSGMLYAASVALPAWLVAAFAATRLARWVPSRFSGLPPFPSVGAVVTLAAIVGMISAAATLTAVIVMYHGYAEGARAVAEGLAAMAAEAFADGAEAKAFADQLVRAGPAAIAGSTLLMLSVNLYAAARSVQLSHRLERPWPDLPTSLGLPAPLGLVAIACAAAAWFLPAPASQYALVVAGGLGTAFVFQGLAVAHALSRGLRLRTLMLIALYACCLLRAKYTLPLLALLGVVDAFTRLRARAALPTLKPNRRK
ncbi:putative membrane protein DUF2232 [Roseiarcus fermentans]|uniref:Putative membrane protein DUF2232 n=1 Tax=Roseiarcus fermentans TaxID=1473586 RepID=A0A366FQE2_9HYPH|nr:DUF2232 domain-containing protein [Roseiarcus fermentans]RBP16838.1 putative membrane protein DUF2232 [Roseiarcus fermentans]